METYYIKNTDFKWFIMNFINKFFTCFIITGLIITQIGFAEKKQKLLPREKFLNIVELTKLIEQARDAGFSNEDLKKLEIKNGNKTIMAVPRFCKLKICINNAMG